MACLKLDLPDDDAPYAVCPSIDDNHETPGTMDHNDSSEGAGTGVSMGGRAHSSHDTIEHADEGSGMCKAGLASDDAPHVIHS